MKLFKNAPFRRAAQLLTLGALALLVWWLASRPVLFHSRFLAAAEDRSCRDYGGGETGIPVLNPFRSRSPERAADAVLKALSKGACPPDWSQATCALVRRHPITAQSWRVVNRADYPRGVLLVYRLYSQEQARRIGDGCSLLSFELLRTGTTWEVSKFGPGSLIY